MDNDALGCRPARLPGFSNDELDKLLAATADPSMLANILNCYLSTGNRKFDFSMGIPSDLSYSNAQSGTVTNNQQQLHFSALPNTLPERNLSTFMQQDHSNADIFNSQNFGTSLDRNVLNGQASLNTAAYSPLPTDTMLLSSSGSTQNSPSLSSLFAHQSKSASRFVQSVDSRVGNSTGSGSIPTAQQIQQRRHSIMPLISSGQYNSILDEMALEAVQESHSELFMTGQEAAAPDGNLMRKSSLSQLNSNRFVPDASTRKGGQTIYSRQTTQKQPTLPNWQRRRHSALPGLLSYLPWTQRHNTSSHRAAKKYSGFVQQYCQGGEARGTLTNGPCVNSPSSNGGDLSCTALNHLAALSVANNQTLLPGSDNSHIPLAAGVSDGAIEPMAVDNNGSQVSLDVLAMLEELAVRNVEKQCEHCNKAVSDWSFYPGTKIALCPSCVDYLERAAHSEEPVQATLSTSMPTTTQQQLSKWDDVFSTIDTNGRQLIGRDRNTADSTEMLIEGESLNNGPAQSTDHVQKTKLAKTNSKGSGNGGPKRRLELKADCECANCKTRLTTLWRRSEGGQLVCNACGLYERLHKCPRPTSIFHHNTSIQKRNRKKKKAREVPNAAVRRTGISSERRHSAPSVIDRDLDGESPAD